MPELPSTPPPGARAEHCSAQQVVCYTPNDLRAYALAYGEMVREECAKVCEALVDPQDEDDGRDFCLRECAAAIREESA